MGPSDKLLLGDALTRPESRRGHSQRRTRMDVLAQQSHMKISRPTTGSASNST